jgi:polyferredoxin
MSRRKRRAARPAALPVLAPAPAVLSVEPEPLRRRPSRLRAVVGRRRAVQAAVALALFWAIGPGGVSLGWVVLTGSAAGVLLGKFFCRWMCPMGAMMELMMGAGGDRQKSFYTYFKLGCPIAWAGGLLNRLSLLRVKLRPERCSDCGRCDEACYVSRLANGRSLHLPGRVNASTDYTCSRCLACVGACPTGALTVGLAGRRVLPDVTGARAARRARPAAAA